MKASHDKRKMKVAEPVQVYLSPPDRARLDRIADDLNATKSDVLRRALEALEQQLADPESNPALRLIGIAGQYSRRSPRAADVAVNHDKYLADEEIASWSKPKRKKRGV